MRFRDLLTVAATAVVAVAVLAGCGSSDDNTVSAQDKGKLELVANQINKAVRTGDGARFCSFVQPDKIDEVFGSKAKCVSTVGSGLKLAKKRNLHVKVASIKSTGENTATVTYAPSTLGAINFISENGAWYISLAGATPENSSGGQGTKSKNSGSGKSNSNKESGNKSKGN
jgi:hypothetical protein